MLTFGKIRKILRDYCENTSLVGLSYISNQKIHSTERIFWLICIIVSAGGSYFLIKEYEKTFESHAISLVIEDIKTPEKVHHPATAVCEQGVVGDYKELNEYVSGLTKDLKEEDAQFRYDVEDYLLRIVYPNMYSMGSFHHYCKYDCEDCRPQCPKTGYKELAAKVRANCSDMIVDCFWNGKPFTCCDYFLPLQTSKGKCFILNSRQTTKSDNPNWSKSEIDWDQEVGELKFNMLKSYQLQIQNTEDVPIILLNNNLFEIRHLTIDIRIQLRLQSIINDPDVQDISPQYRKCKFPNENSENSSYKYYSFATCVSDCLKQLQLTKCGCVTYNNIVNSSDQSPQCDGLGFLCLEKEDILKPSPTILQPWRSKGLMCKCLPSCTEHDIRIFDGTVIERPEGTQLVSSVNIRQSAATQQYRRQAVRSRLDVVVTIGGILGLFMGASILSGIEIIYFFFIRIFNMKN